MTPIYKYYNNNKIEIIIDLTILLLSLPVLVGCLFAVPSADDFSNAVGWINWDGNHLIYFFRNIVDIYNTWQGTYSGLAFVTIPVYSIFGIWGLRLFLLAGVLLFFISLYLLLVSLCHYFNGECKPGAVGMKVLLLVCLCYLIGTNDISQIFYWYTGECVYTIPICCAMLCFSFYLQYENTNKNHYLLIAIIMAFIAVGGSLNIAAMTCSILILITLYALIVQKRRSKGIIVEVTAIMGACINVVAPGNYMRHGENSGLKVGVAIITTMERVCNILSEELQSGWLLVLLVISFLVGFFLFSESKFEFKYPIAIVFWSIISIFITDFPVVLGYDSNVFPSRCVFVEKIVICLVFIIVSMYLGGWCRSRRLFDINSTTILLLSLICFCMFADNFRWDSIMSFTPTAMSYHIANGDFKAASEREMRLLYQISESCHDDVVVEVDKGESDEWTNIKGIGLTEDETWWVNTAVSNYYRKKSVVIKYLD